MLAQATTDGSTWIWIVIAIIVVVAIVAYAASRRRSDGLRRRFGPEYERTVAATGSPRRAETELAARERRVRELNIRPLTPGARDRYVADWRAVQARFVDDPRGAVADGDRLITDVMQDRGYPVSEPAEQRMENLSVEHAGVLDHYRAATAIASRSARGDVKTEDLRQAMVHYRTLFTDLVGDDPIAPSGSAEGRILEPRRADSTQGVR